MKNLFVRLSQLAPWGITVVRVMMGVVMTYHGLGKVLYGGYAVGFFGKIGIPIPMVSGPFVSLVELLGGLALIAGLFTRYVGGLFFLQFLVVLYARLVLMNTGYGGAELEFMLLVSAVLLATNGSGPLALDRIFRRWEP
jgi:putative oxidoreductase